MNSLLNNKKSNYINHPLIKPNSIVRREYQEKIFVSAVGKNTLVVLPTSMGKTIIAILLAVYYLSEDADNKVIFLAPTKPLVVQHQRSFKELTEVGKEEWQLPVLTGSISPAKRKKLFLDGRVIFMTPQVMQNDIISNQIDLSNVKLIIFDEAHRAVGNYAYVFIADMYLKKNPKGHILALTASPGGNEEKIKEVCTNLHINNIEIRTERSKDVKPYVQDLKIEWIKVVLPEEYKAPNKILKNLLKEYTDKLIEEEILDKSDGYITRKNLLNSSRILNKLIESADSIDLPRYLALKKVVSNAIRISHMLELLEAQGVRPLYEFLQKNYNEISQSNAPKSLKELFLRDEIRIVLENIKKLVEKNFVHPKLIKLKEILHSEFKKNPNSRVLVFANFRDTINSIIEYLKNDEIIKAQKFIGQQSKKVGSSSIKGMSQKEQIAILENFRQGIFNVLVATSVAEEGLDIAECNLVIFYDVVPSEIRAIQRRGRTARKSAGRVLVLMTIGTREEGYYWASKKREREMKKTLINIQKKVKEFSESGSSFSNVNKEDFRKKGLEATNNILHYMDENIIDSMTSNKGQPIRSDNQSSATDAIAKENKVAIVPSERDNDKDEIASKLDDNAKMSMEKTKLKRKLGDLLSYLNQGNENYENKRGISERSSEKKEKTSIVEKPEKMEEMIADGEIFQKGEDYLTIIVDSRETQSAVVRRLALQGANIILRQLPSADYIISDNIGIERKTDIDFQTSLKDGRLFNELHNLKLNFEIPILIIEGNPLASSGFPRKAILGAISSIIINMQINMVYTANAEETADLLIAFLKKVNLKKGTTKRIFKKKADTIAEAQEQVIGGIPGINLYRAQDLLSYFSNLKNIFNASEDELKKIPGIGKKLAKKIKEIAEHDYNSSK
ncbi:MAG: helicase-related protein [Promethearchaeota archaeon]